MSDSHKSRESSLEQDVQRLYKDMYFGNGLPGMTTRMKTVEDDVIDLKEYNKEKDSRLYTRMNLMIGAFFSLAIAIVLHLIFTPTPKH